MIPTLQTIYLVCDLGYFGLADDLPDANISLPHKKGEAALSKNKRRDSPANSSILPSNTV